MRKTALSLIAFATLFCLASSSAHAQATRTWVSAMGDDTNACSRTAPCRTFAGALSKTAAFGDIHVLDPGVYGGVTITKSISIVNEGVGEAGVLVSGTNAIIINAGTNDVVRLRGLFIQGLGTGLNGINFLAGRALHVENCVIMGFGSTAAGNGNGINFQPTTFSAELYVQDTMISENFSNGILVKPGIGGSAKASIDRVHVENNGVGLKVDGTNGTVSATIRESVAAGNAAAGYHAFSPGATAASMIIDHSAAASNITGIFAETGAGAIIRISDMTVLGHVTGLSATGSAKVFSYVNNHFAGNGTDGTPSLPNLSPL